MQQEQTFVPEVGYLVTRVVLHGDGNVEFALCYRDDAQDELHFRHLARIRGFIAEPNFIGCVECALGAPNVWPAVNFHYTTWEELCALPRLWTARRSFLEWLDDVSQSQGLREDQLDRLRRAFNLGLNGLTCG